MESEKKISISVIMPAYNSGNWVLRSLDKLADAVQNAPQLSVDVIIIDDGSTDDTATLASNFGRLSVKVISTSNQGRFRARQNGLEHATGDHVLLLDTRVFLDPSSLLFISEKLSSGQAQLWTAHVEAATDRNPIARFWRAIEHFFWRRYFSNPRTTSFGLDDFDYFPKGTTALVAPRKQLIDVVNSFEPTVANWHKVNDDTAVIRVLAETMRINISPEYRCTYNARTNLRQFLAHANHRGSVLIDGYLRPGTRLRLPIVAVVSLVPIALIACIFNPIAALVGVLLLPLSVGALFLFSGVSLLDTGVLSVLFWPFSVAYLLGMYKGLFLRIRGNRG